MPSRTPEGDALTALVLPAFELNGEFLAAAEHITDGHELTPALWQVLGSVLDERLPVAEIARRVGLGLARQSVQRSANLLVERGWARWEDNPAHRRAKLLAPTPAGVEAIEAFRTRQHAWANAVGADVGLDELRELDRLLRRITLASRRARTEGAMRRGGALDSGEVGHSDATGHAGTTIDEDDTIHASANT